MWEGLCLPNSSKPYIWVFEQSFEYANSHRKRQFVHKMLGPEAPRVAAVKKLNLVHRGKCRGFFVKFFAAIFP